MEMGSNCAIARHNCAIARHFRLSLTLLTSRCLSWVTLLTVFICLTSLTEAQEFFGCGGFIKSDAVIDFSKIEIKLYTKQGALKDSTDCAPNNGYYLIPVYDKGEYVIKVESEAGWTFSPAELSVNVDGSTDACSKGEDINFQFDGLTVSGVVLSAGDVTGPVGVVVDLVKEGQKINTATTDDVGRYSFTSILPGEYVIEASRADLLFSKSSFPIVISAEEKEIEQVITVAGYDVSGRVVSEGEPIKGVQFILLAEPGSPAPADCAVDSMPSSPSEVEAASGLAPLCYVISGDDGSFLFRLLSNGRYAVVPHYSGENIRFDVLPPALDIDVRHAHKVIEEVFKVEGFTVQGAVRVTSSGSPFVGARISIDGVFTSSTDEAGVYKLENIKTGTYTINVDAPAGSGYYFAATSIKITPNTPLLPEILPNEFDVCGRISIQQIPPVLVSKFSSSDRRLEVTRQGQLVATIGVRLGGVDGAAFCTRLPAGDYVIAVVTAEEEAGHGFVLSPSASAATVTHHPVADIEFRQAMGSLRGVVECLESCHVGSEEDPMRVIVTSLARSERVLSLQVSPTEDPKRSLFHAANILPGKYNVSIVKKSLCWQLESVVVETSMLEDPEIADVVFAQSGFRLSCDISHDTQLNFEMEKESSDDVEEAVTKNDVEENVGSFRLVKGLNRFCLSHPGVYNLMPKSDCHQFAQDVYQFKTSSSFPTLRITAVRHALNAEIHADVETSDLTAQVTSLLDDAQVTLGPLQRVAHAPGMHVYRMRHWGRHGESFTIAPSAANLLFKPETVTKTLKSDDGCQGPVAVLKGTEGIFISGHVTPAIPNVRIIITPEKTPDLRLLVETDENGRYRVGPQDGSTKYSVVAEKENFVMTPLADDSYSFDAFKLGEIKVQVLDGEEESAGAALGGVLLSLSGGKGYRSNNMTNGDGSLAFTHLSPGQYYLRPMKKEYQFEPPSQMIDVIEGTTVNLKIIGNRVAFSIYGNVNSLNSDGENGITVEAFGPGDVEGCSVSQEEAKTDAGGAFRIRGLTPGCNYKIRVKSAETCPGNRLLERTTPTQMNVAMETRDLHNLTFIALRKIKEMDVSGHVKVSLEHVTSLKAKLCLEDNEESPVHTISLGQVPFFFFPAIPIDDRKYVVILESSLARQRFDYPESMKATFVADRPFKHLKFTFQPTVKSVDAAELGLQTGGLLTFPIILLLLLAAYYHEILLAFLSALIAHLSEAAKQVFAAASRPIGAANGSGDDLQILRRKKKAHKDQ